MWVYICDPFLTFTSSVGINECNTLIRIRIIQWWFSLNNKINICFCYHPYTKEPAYKKKQPLLVTSPAWFLSDHWRNFGSAAQLPADHVVPVIICASEERMGATMATINSVHSNTDASVFFYVVTLRDAVKLTRYETHSGLLKVQ